MSKTVVSIAAFRDGKLLMGLRGDSGRWNLPGGHMEPGDGDPLTTGARTAAERELKEETGLDGTRWMALGFCDVREGLRVYSFVCEVEGKADASSDPDEEMVAFKWLDPKNLPRSVMDKLHNRKDVTLQFLGLQDRELDLIWDEDEGHDHQHFVDGLTKAERLVKMGAMSRLAPFNPATTNRLPAEHEKNLARWQNHLTGATREAIAPMSPEARTRSLHQLAKVTPSRRGFDGQREFLLHRGMSSNEKAGTVMPQAGINGADVANHESASSSWTPHHHIAQKFAQTYSEGGRAHVLSAWVPEESISMVPRQYGRITTRADRVVKPGRNEYEDEHEVVVSPDYQGEIVPSTQLSSLMDPFQGAHTRSVDGRINMAGQNDPGLTPRTKRNMMRYRLEQGNKTRKFEDQLGDWMAKAEGNLLGESLDDAVGLATDMAGFNPQVHEAFKAAQFMAGGKALSLEEVRNALYAQDDDYEAAALAAYQFPIDEEHLRSLRALIQIDQKPLGKAEEAVPAGKDIEPGLPDAIEASDQVKAAFRDQQVRPIQLGGKHSSGTLIAKDPQSQNIYLLKPGSGGQSPAAGAGDEHASQSRREAAFWHIADDWGLGDCIPKADLVMIDGREYAALRMLPFTFKNLDKKKMQEPGLPRACLDSYRNRGILTKWAVLDYVLGNPDRHGSNLMVDQDDKTVALIDHGSAFAGDRFDPAYDRNSFVPYYLRVWAPQRFNILPIRQKLQFMPQVNQEVRKELRDWLDNIHADHIQGLLTRYGIDPGPSLSRLGKVKVLASESPVDEAINRLWITT